MPSQFNEISPQNLMRLVGTPDCPVILDVRLAEDIAQIPFFVPTAQPTAHDAVDQFSFTPAQKIVVICHKGKKLSHGAAAILRSQGYAVEVLTGGAVAWAEAALPAVPLKTLNAVTNTWVTRHRPKIDRIACPWLIKRFVQPDARVLFVPPAEVDLVADRFNGTAFDMPDGDWSHRGEFCTFDLMIERFGLSHPALETLATVVRAADTNRHDLAPQAAGLLAISTGLSRQYKDDTQQLYAGLAIYDALYRWARDAQSEGHDWPTSGGA